MKILLKPDNELSKVYLRYADLLKKSNKYDAIISKQDATKEILNEYRELLVIERMDSAGIWCRDLLAHEHVKTVLKMYCYYDFNLHNRFAVGGRIFLNSINANPAEKKLQLPEITPEQFKKIMIGFNFFHYEYFHKLFEMLKNVEIKPIEERKLDLFFAGTVEYDISNYAGLQITGHRKNCINNILKCGKRGLAVEAADKRIYRYSEYMNKLMDAKIVLSPFGWGEYCYRDYEALLCGCIVVKPYFEPVISVPCIYYQMNVIATEQFKNFDLNRFNHLILQERNTVEISKSLQNEKLHEKQIIEEILA